MSKQYSFPDVPDNQDNQYCERCVCGIVKPGTPALNLFCLDRCALHPQGVCLVDKHGVVLEIVFVQHH